MQSLPPAKQSLSAASIAPFCALDAQQTEPRDTVTTVGGRRWYSIERVESMRPFLMSLISDSDHWMFLLSNGGMTAGRINPDHALLPYYTQDKLQDMAGASGNQTLVMVETEDGEHFWEPFKPTWNRSRVISRTLSKNDLGNHIVLEETHHELELKLTMSWRPSEQFGFVRRMEITNIGESSKTLRLLDGIRNILPAGIGQRFQNEFSILGDAYKQCEILEGSDLGIYHLSSRPTDLAEPLEALIANVVWQTGLNGEAILLNEEWQESFLRNEQLHSERTLRGRRGAYLGAARWVLPADQSHAWYTCADIEKDPAAIQQLHNTICNNGPALPALIEADCTEAERRLCKMLSAADGFQWTAATKRTLRHTSNTTFNLMRGGTFITGYKLPKEDLLRSLAHFNPAAAEDLTRAIENMDEISVHDLWTEDSFFASLAKDTQRLLREYLPLSFSRRHGDPSRPWNRFSIEIKEVDGAPRFSYQGNWRDIFQNWEALLMSYPSYTEATIFRFLNATTADGYNPYRLTKDGFEWEVLEPGDEWANIGYWGDHQIVYLLRLLEASSKFHPGRLDTCLHEEIGVYAQIPYRLRSFEQMLQNTRETVDYDQEWATAIDSAVKVHGADGKLMRDKHDDVLYVTLLEKLLVPLLGKLSNFIPSGGIWMNTQRPEWNDANNALVGNGISVVTTGYVARYLRHLIDLTEDNKQQDSFLSAEVATLLQQQHQIFSSYAPSVNDQQRLAFMREMGSATDRYRSGLYDNGLSGNRTTVGANDILEFLNAALKHVNACLLDNRRPDGLWHSYNLLRIHQDSAEIERLYVMLEGQVSILSAGVLSAEESIELLTALRSSQLYREDQDSYVLYPDRQRPAFVDKNRVPAKRLEESGLATCLLTNSNRILVQLPDGNFSFNGAFRNQRDLLNALNACPNLSAAERQACMDIFEETFHHHAFTGRSGTFFAYEGLGSIYWHMVSKLVLAVQEIIPGGENPDDDSTQKLKHFYRALREGLGVHKSPGHYGAFPTDAYSHTPGHCGAQQPGMTGQVKEDILIRLREMGISIENGRIQFQENLIEEEELFDEPQQFEYEDLVSGLETLNIPANGMAFSLCQVPFVCSKMNKKLLHILFRDGSERTVEGHALPADLSALIFKRTGTIQQIRVGLQSH
jgi:hypothetical protein